MSEPLKGKDILTLQRAQYFMSKEGSIFVRESTKFIKEEKHKSAVAWLKDKVYGLEIENKEYFKLLEIIDGAFFDVVEAKK